MPKKKQFRITKKALERMAKEEEGHDISAGVPPAQFPGKIRATWVTFKELAPARHSAYDFLGDNSYELTDGVVIGYAFHKRHAWLFSAAPDLLAACKAILVLLEEGQADTLTVSHDGKYLREAILKAEGGK